RAWPARRRKARSGGGCGWAYLPTPPCHSRSYQSEAPLPARLSVCRDPRSEAQKRKRRAARQAADRLMPAVTARRYVLRASIEKRRELPLLRRDGEVADGKFSWYFVHCCRSILRIDLRHR